MAGIYCLKTPLLARFLKILSNQSWSFVYFWYSVAQLGGYFKRKRTFCLGFDIGWHVYNLCYDTLSCLDKSYIDIGVWVGDFESGCTTPFKFIRHIHDIGVLLCLVISSRVYDFL